MGLLPSPLRHCSRGLFLTIQGPGISGLGSVSSIAHRRPSLLDSQRPVTVRGTSEGTTWVSSRGSPPVSSPRPTHSPPRAPGSQRHGSRVIRALRTFQEQLRLGDPQFSSVSVSRAGASRPGRKGTRAPALTPIVLSRSRLQSVQRLRCRRAVTPPVTVSESPHFFHVGQSFQRP